MAGVVPAISTVELAVAFVPAVIVIAIMFHWRARAMNAVYATVRMLAQLLLIGYVLIYLFDSDHFGMILAVLALMLMIASRIAIQPLEQRDRHMYVDALVAISLGSLPTLALVTQMVIKAEPWYAPRYIIPLSGMIFANAMNTVSLAAERLRAETDNGTAIAEARRIAFQASMIPLTNSFFAVGLVSLPGMMTGQVLSGVSPLVAAKYQIVVMTMLFGASGVASAIYLARRSRRAIEGS